MKNKRAKHYKEEIEDLIASGKTNPEIAETLELTRGQVSCFVEKFLGGNPNYLKRITKHKHLHEKLLKYKLHHSEEECADKFNLTRVELKSCLISAYNDSNLRHIRKDNRRRDAWSSEELRFLLRFSGIIPQDKIASILNRGKTRVVIKEKLQLLNLCSKNVNGLTYSQFTSIFKTDPKFYIQTIAGSPSFAGSMDAHWKIVPWCHIKELIKDREIDCVASLKVYIDTMSLFQKWLHGEDYWRSLTSAPVFKNRIKTNNQTGRVK